MDFLRAIAGFFAIAVIALFLGRMDHHRNPEVYTYGWIASIAVLLLMRFFL